ncbi:MAG TPA: anti-sigma factor [Motilibacterales bacterium]|nr:anti-sigma factor [Motilibacterales bacterium]
MLPPRSRPRRAAHSARGRWPMIAVAASALVVGGIAGSSVTRLLTRSTPPAVRTIAQTTLAGLPLAPAAKGTAVIVQTPAGPRLDIDVTPLGPVQGHFYEVWLIDKNLKNMVPVGILQGTTGDFVVPAGLDLSAYPLVDISIQLPGDPKHSGQSVLRGTTSI